MEQPKCGQRLSYTDFGLADESTFGREFANYSQDCELIDHRGQWITKWYDAFAANFDGKFGHGPPPAGG